VTGKIIWSRRVGHWPSSLWPRVALTGTVLLEGRLSAARLEGGQMRAGANPRGMQRYGVGR